MILPELIFGVLEFFESWRLYVAIGLCVAAIWFVNTTMTNETARLAVSILLGIPGISFGVYWQLRSRSNQVQPS